ncbi:MAG: segregation/condensation protein A [Candidatus Eremiobacteraeota bacterium]|nr:segregation/condensation protein A [Candidatus Eremiobacteraeota bacterium]MBV8280908.1 segregation/condensation protein A [Candidatus Eremiobacteraeota bacterium]
MKTASAPTAAETAAEAIADRKKLLVKLDVFDGPLDLLLHLVLEQDLDIVNVSLADVCDQYVAYLRLMESLDIDVASEYLVIAATLLFIKSKKLLPPPPAPFADDLDEDAAFAEEVLRQRLIAYAHFKRLGEQFRARFEEQAGYFTSGAIAEEGLVQHYALQAPSLALALERALANAAARPAVVKRETFSMVVKMNYVLRQVRERVTLAFSELIEGCRRLEVVVTFLALLELVKARKVVCEQPKLFSDIIVTPAPKGATDQLGKSA